MIDLLHPEQAALIAGVPAVQLRRWAFFGLGPKNSGTKFKPLFDEDDVKAWRAKIDRERLLALADMRLIGGPIGNAFDQNPGQ